MRLRHIFPVFLPFLFILILISLSACGILPEQNVVESTPTPEATPTPVPTPAEPEPVETLLKASDGTELKLTDESTEVFLDNVDFFPGLAENAAQLPALRSIQLADGLAFTAADVSFLQEAFPDADVSYRVVISGQEYDRAAQELDLSGLTPEQLEEAAVELQKFPALTYVSLTPMEENSTEAQAETEDSAPETEVNKLSLEQVGMLQQVCPEVAFDYRFELFGKTISTADERLEYENTNIGDAGVEEQIRPILPYMTKLSYLKLDKCEVTSENMAKLRDDFSDIKVVWRVYFSRYGECGDGTMAVYNTLTDAEKIWATGCVTDGFTKELQYCTDVKYLDLGHNCITNIDFVNYMPELEVAVLSISWVTDLSPLANCPKLEYLEIFSSRVTDITPLSKCTSLKHLNISNLPEVRDITCLYGLDLERLFCTMSHIPQDQQEEFRTLHPDCECEFGWVDPSKGRWRFVDGNENNDTPENYVERYALLRKQLGYDTFDYSK